MQKGHKSYPEQVKLQIIIIKETDLHFTSFNS